MGFEPFTPDVQKQYQQKYGATTQQSPNMPSGYTPAPKQKIGNIDLVNPQKEIDIENKKIKGTVKELPSGLYDTVLMGPQTIEQFQELGNQLKKVDESQIGPNAQIKQSILSKVPLLGEKLTQENFSDKFAIDKSIGLVAKPWGRQLEGGRTTDTDYEIYLKMFMNTNEPKPLREYGYNNAFRLLVKSYNRNLDTLKKLNVDTGDLQSYDVPPPAVLPSAYKNHPSVKLMNNALSKYDSGNVEVKQNKTQTFDLKKLTPKDLDSMTIDQLNELEKQLTK